jgi:hypothetical protein
MGSGHGKPAALVGGFHLKPLLAAVIAPAAHHAQRLIGMKPTQSGRLLIRGELKNLAAGTEQRLAGAAAAHIGHAAINTTGRQGDWRKQGERQQSPPAPSAQALINGAHH